MEILNSRRSSKRKIVHIFVLVVWAKIQGHHKFGVESGLWTALWTMQYHQRYARDRPEIPMDHAIHPTNILCVCWPRRSPVILHWTTERNLALQGAIYYDLVLCLIIQANSVRHFRSLPFQRRKKALPCVWTAHHMSIAGFQENAFCPLNNAIVCHRAPRIGQQSVLNSLCWTECARERDSHWTSGSVNLADLINRSDTVLWTMSASQLEIRKSRDVTLWSYDRSGTCSANRSI